MLLSVQRICTHALSHTKQQSMTTQEKDLQALHLLAPVSGKTMKLDSVPDPVFSEKLTGDGLAILAEGDEVLAPCDGEITLFFDTKHAFAITTPDGVQVLVHVGLDTIIMNGDGLTALKRSGEKVTAGTPIIKLDRPLLEKRNINMICPVLIVNYEKVREIQPIAAGESVIAGEDTVIQYAM